MSHTIRVSSKVVEQLKNIKSSVGANSLDEVLSKLISLFDEYNNQKDKKKKSTKKNNATKKQTQAKNNPESNAVLILNRIFSDEKTIKFATGIDNDGYKWLVHIFQKQVREFYDIESLWGDAKITAVQTTY